MTLAADLLSRAPEQAERLTAEGIERGLDYARGLALDASRSPLAGGMTRADLGEVAKALDALEAERHVLAGAARDAVTGALVLLSVGRDDEARRLWLAGGGASYDERRAASAASTAATLEAARRRAEVWAALERIARTAGRVALRIAIPLLLAAL